MTWKQAVPWLAAGALSACSSEAAPDSQPEPEPWTNMLPRPDQASRSEGAYAIAATAGIAVEPSGQGLEQVGEMLAVQLRRAMGFEMAVQGGAVSTGGIRLVLDESADGLGDEGYELKVDAGGVTIRAASAGGVFHGTRTLRQLRPARVESGSVQPGSWVVAASRRA